MKRYLFLLLSLWYLSLSAQTPVYVYNFKQVITPGTKDKKNGVGKLTIYDDLTAELYIKAGTREYRKSIKFLSYNFGIAGGFLYSSREKSNKNAPHIMISVSGISAYYIEDDEILFGGQISDTDDYPNESVYEKMKRDMDNNSGIFSIFHNPINDILPYRFESPDVMRLKVDDASKGVYSGLVNYEGGLVGIIAYLKSGKYPDDLGIQYDLEITPMKGQGQTVDWISVVNPHPNCLAINIEPNNGSRSRMAILIFNVKGKEQGRILVIQLAEGSTAPW